MQKGTNHRQSHLTFIHLLDTHATIKLNTFLGYSSANADRNIMRSNLHQYTITLGRNLAQLRSRKAQNKLIMY